MRKWPVKIAGHVDSKCQYLSPPLGRSFNVFICCICMNDLVQFYTELNENRPWIYNM